MNTVKLWHALAAAALALIPPPAQADPANAARCRWPAPSPCR